MALAVAIYLAFNAGSSSAQGWGIAMSTDTAFALGLLALVGPRFPDRLRAFMLTVVVVDDILALVVIATVYTEQVSAPAPPGGIRAVRRGARGAGAGCAGRARLLRARSCDLGGAARVRGRAGRGRARDGAPGLRVPGPALRARTRNRALPRVPRAADPGARPLRRRRAQGGGLAQRAAPAALPPLDELPHRAAVRARERGHRDRRRLPRRRRHLAHHARNPLRLRHRQARRHLRLLVAAHAAHPRDGCGRRSAGRRSPAGERSPGSGSPSRCSSPRLRSREGSSRRQSSASSAPRSALRSSPGCCFARRRCCLGGCGSARCSEPRSRSPTSTSRSTPSATIFAARSRRRSRSSSTATSSAPTAGWRSRSSASSCVSSATCATSGGTCR